MLNETETAHLAQLVRDYGLKGVVDALATHADKRADEAERGGSLATACAWGHDARALRRQVASLWTGGRGRP